MDPNRQGEGLLYVVDLLGVMVAERDQTIERLNRQIEVLTEQLGRVAHTDRADT